MDTNQINNLIPKTKEKPRLKSLGILATILQVVLLVCLLTTVGVFGMIYRSGQEISEKKLALGQNLNGLEPAFLQDIKKLENHISASQEVFSNHLAISRIFQILETVTIRAIRFEQFEYTFSDQGSIKVYLIGQAKGYSDIATQAKLFNENKAIGSYLFYDFVLLENGQVNFKLDVFFKKEFINYDYKN